MTPWRGEFRPRRHGVADETYAEKCPTYQSVKGCIECSWDAEIVEE